MDNMLLLANGAFTDRKESELYKAWLMAKECEQLTAEKPLKFNSGIVQLITDGLMLIQKH
jgi:hypothetical protein